MITVVGKYTKVNIMTDDVEASALSQVYEFANNPSFTNTPVIMPDVHQGKGAVIGFTMEIPNRIIPNVVGVDQSCGVAMFLLSKKALNGIDLPHFDQAVRKAVPMSSRVNSKPKLDMENEFDWPLVQQEAANFTTEFNKRYGTMFKCPVFDLNYFRQLCKRVGVAPDYAINSLGSMGSGNHYIEIGKDESENLWLSVHSGSRNIGLKTAVYWQDIATKQLLYKRGQWYKDTLNIIKVNFPKDEWAARIKEIPVEPKGPFHLDYLEGENMFLYLIDAVFLNIYAKENRNLIANEVVNLLPDKSILDSFHTVHNYVDYKDFIIRKGAVASYTGQRFALPFNHEDGILICEGKSNPEWNFSAPHGAGRPMSRSDAKAVVDVDAATASLRDKGVYCSVVPADETKDAYKPSEEIEKAITPTATILHRVKPIINFKTKK